MVEAEVEAVVIGGVRGVLGRDQSFAGKSNEVEMWA